MLDVNIEFFKIRPCAWGLFEQTKMGLFRLFRLTPQNIWYIQHCSDTSHPMFELIPGVGLVRAVKNLTLTCFL